MIRVSRVVEHHWSLERTATSAAGSWDERHSLLVVVRDEDGTFGLGEAAPLPGFSRDSLGSARDALSSALGQSCPELDPTLPLAHTLGPAVARIGSPAARAALQTALIDAWARRQGAPGWRLLAPDAPARAPVALWLPDGVEQALPAARLALGRGVAALKVKLDPARGLENGVATLEALRRELGPAVALRADANRRPTLAELEPYLPRLRTLALEWLEEPTSDPLTDLGIPVALDESLQDNPGNLKDRPYVTAFVLKPTVLGGPAQAGVLAKVARMLGRSAVASHALEGPVGYMSGALLALSLGAGTPHGLAPYSGLRLRPPALDPERDELVAWTAPGLGLTADEALAGTSIVADHRA